MSDEKVVKDVFKLSELPPEKQAVARKLAEAGNDVFAGRFKYWSVKPQMGKRGYKPVDMKA